MPRVRDMKKMVNTIMTVESVDSRQQAQYSDDEKTTTSSGNGLGSLCVRSAIKGADGRGRKMPRQKRSLRFDPYDEVCEIPHINDLSPEEVRDCWMTQADLRSIRQECLGTVDDIGDAKITDGMLLRGLDQHTSRYKEARDFISRQVYDAVFSVQEFEIANGVDCSDLMAQLSAKYSEPSVISAQSAALSDLFSSFKGTWTHRSIPTIPDGPPASGTWATMTDDC